MLTSKVAASVCSVLFVLLSACAQTKDERQTTTVTGVLMRVVGIGGETTGWAIRFESEVEIEGKLLKSIEVSYKIEELAKFEDKRVRVTGKMNTRRGPERGAWPVLEVDSIEEVS